MAFVKLDCGMLDSTLWIDRLAREIFITALLMAEPHELTEPMAQIKVNELEKTGFIVPVGWYGFVPAAGPGIVRRSGIEPELGLLALERLGEPEAESRTPDFGGRRMVRIDGGYLILNYDKYRQKDHTAAERSKRYRERKLSRVTSVASRVASRSVTQAEAYKNKESSVASLPLSRFLKPSLDELKLHCTKIGLPEPEAEKFFNYYESNGWKVGRNSMKSWQSALVNWKTRGQSYQQNGNSKHQPYESVFHKHTALDAI